MVKKLLILFFILSTLSVQAQIETIQFVEGLTINSTKNQVIDFVVKKTKEFVRVDRREIQKKLKKNGHKINDKTIEAFLIKMEQDIRVDLQKQDDWDKSTMKDKYVLSPRDILGFYLHLPGLDKANTNKMGNGSVYLKFKDGKIMTFQSTVATTRHDALPSGYSYNTTHQNKISSLIQTLFGNFKLKSTTDTTWQCSSRGDKIYYESFEFSKNEFHGNFFYTFSPQFKSTGINMCEAIGTQLTEVSLYLNRQNTQESDFKQMN